MRLSRYGAVAAVFLLCLTLSASSQAARQGPWARPATDLVPSSKTYRYGSPSLAAGNDGTVAATWLKSNDTATTVEVATRRPGKVFSKPVSVGSGERGYQPQIAIGPNGTTTVTWLEITGQVWKYKVATRPSGKTFGPPVTLDQISSSVLDLIGAKNISIGVGANGTTVVAWRVPGQAGSHIEAAVSPRGGSFSSAQLLSPDSDGLSVSEPDVSVQSDGSATVVWSQKDAISGLTVIRASTRPETGSFAAPEDLSQPSIETEDDQAGPQNPQVSSDVDGSTTAVWSRFDGAVTMTQTSNRPAGGEFGEPVDVSTASPNDGNFDPQIAVGKDGSAAIVWITKRLRSEEIDYQEYTYFVYIPYAISRTPGGDFKPSKVDFIGVWSGGLDASHPRASISSNGTLTVVWEQELKDGNGSLFPVAYAAWRNRGGSWSRPTNLSRTSGANAGDPEIVTDPTGRATSIWDLSDSSGWRIQSSSTLPAYCYKATLDRERGRSNRNKGIAWINASVGTPGRLWITGSPDVKPYSVYVRKKGVVTVKLAPRGDARKQQAENGYVDLTADLWFNPKPGKCSLKTKKIRTRIYLGKSH